MFFALNRVWRISITTLELWMCVRASVFTRVTPVLHPTRKLFDPSSSSLCLCGWPHRPWRGSVGEMCKVILRSGYWRMPIQFSHRENSRFSMFGFQFSLFTSTHSETKITHNLLCGPTSRRPRLITWVIFSFLCLMGEGLYCTLHPTGNQASSLCPLEDESKSRTVAACVFGCSTSCRLLTAAATPAKPRQKAEDKVGKEGSRDTICDR